MGKYNKLVESYGYTTYDEINTMKGEKHKISDKNGYKFFVTMDRIKRSHVLGCNLMKFSSRNKYTIENINIWLKKNKKERITVISQNYKSNSSVLKCVCQIHGEFESTWVQIQQQIGGGCAKCGEEFRLDKRKKGLEETINDFILIHGDRYDYSDVKYYYKNSHTKIPIICKVHGLFWQTPNSHQDGHGCDECASILRKEQSMCKQNDVIYRMKEVHNHFYEYPDFEYNGMREKIKIICPHHGLFMQSPMKHLYGQGCPKCKSSKLEEKIARFIENKDIVFNREFTFKDCKFKRALPFDFYIKKFNVLIEADGEQHYHPVKFGGISDEQAEENFKLTKKRDAIKTKYCEDNNIKLIRIPYWDFDNIEDILVKELNL